MSDFYNFTYGAALTGQKAWGLNGLRGRLEYTGFNGKEFGVPGYKVTADNTSVFSFAADYIRSFSPDQLGSFIFAGAGLYMSDYSGDDETNAGISAGYGYNFTNNIGAEAKYTKVFGDGADLDFFSVSLSWRF
jgi:hypothetical protein